MTAICFVCNLPILSHQVGLIWQGGNGWDDLVREQVEESTLKQRLGKREEIFSLHIFKFYFDFALELVYKQDFQS